MSSNARRIANIAITECRDYPFGHAIFPRKTAQELVRADEITPEDAAESIRNKYACDASKGYTLVTEQQAEDNIGFTESLDALEAACIAFLYV